MHNFGKYCAAAMVFLASAGVCAQADLKVGTAPAAESSVELPASPAGPMSSAAPRSPVNARYDALIEQELRVSTSSASTAEDFRVVINRFWSFVRRYPTSGFADNALWQAANLSADAFQRFSQDRDKYRALQIFQWLRDQYPHSPLQARVLAQIEQFETVAATAAQVTAPAGAESVIRAVHRDVMSDVVRVTVELDREVPFYQERLEGPARLFFDLKGTKTVASLVDATFRYDSDIVRHIRLGRHPNSTTRVVLDLENVGRYSVFTLYNPYRIVIDAERSAATPPVTIATARRVVDPETAGAHAAHKGLTSRNFAPKAVAPIARIVTRTLPIAAAKPVARVVPVVPDPPIAPPAPAARVVPVPPVAPAPPPANVAGAAPPVIAGKPLAPSANSSGKFSVARQLGLGVSRIVIDAGHGGHDPGASAFGISEAELVLDVTLRLEKLLQEQEGVEVVLTRRTNEYVALDERTEIANRESADLFLSVHANASSNGTARGVETYFLNFALNPQAEAVAARENAASGRTMSSLPSIIKAITLNSKLNESRDFAASIQRSLVRGLRPGNKTLKDLGVKQAPFMVLIGAAMPSVLAEISFVTNPQEARLLKTPAYRQQIAESLLAGILRYQQSLKKVQTAALKQPGN
jgi:N-acetylmuramoyl-L-alanine amidase